MGSLAGEEIELKLIKIIKRKINSSKKKIFVEENNRIVYCLRNRKWITSMKHKRRSSSLQPRQPR